jgi:hypothetical protein
MSAEDLAEFTTYIPESAWKHSEPEREPEARRRSPAHDPGGVARTRDRAVERVSALLRQEPGLRRA